MDRLTDKRFDGEGFYQPKSREERLEIFENIPSLEAIYKRLAEYENTGLTPEQIMKLKKGNEMADIGFVDIEVLQAKNTKVLAINGTRVSKEKGYGMMSVIAKFEVPISDIREIIDGARLDGESE